tara:strand:+ start:936 stop:1568 length:633 start_codon:yes stop_codon:yes gene_type:complete
MINFTPKKISWLNIWQQAEEFREKHKFANQLPVNVEALIEFNLGMDIVPMSGLKAEAEVEAFLSKDLKTIYIDSQGFDNPNYRARHRFTLAEEIGHYVLHKEIYTNGVKYETEEEFINDIRNMDETDLDWVEKQARQFAGRLLVPLKNLEDLIVKNQDLIDLVYKKYDGDDKEEFAIEGFSKKFCDEFGVSHYVVKYRISYEGLNHYFQR